MVGTSVKCSYAENNIEWKHKKSARAFAKSDTDIRQQNWNQSTQATKNSGHF